MQWVGELVKFLEQQYASYGYFIVFFASMLENTVLLGLVLPGGTMVLGGAAFAANGTLSLPLVILAGWAGLFLGNCIDYWIGRFGLFTLIEKTFIKKYADPYMKQAEGYLTERGGTAILISYFLGAIRSFVSVTAGTVKYPFGRFVLYQLAASFIWNLIYCLAGYFLASTVKSLDGIVSGVGILLFVLVILGYGAYKFSEQLRSSKKLVEVESATSEETSLEDPAVVKAGPSADDLK